MPLASSLAVPSGPLTRECFDWLVDDMIGRLERAGAVDGVYLALVVLAVLFDIGVVGGGGHSAKRSRRPRRARD